MSDIIRLLPDSIANQIAAGEVIQRPASVVKELLENSVDASASKIRLIVKDSGKTLVQVIDDGLGMTETDARMSFERHATSKIQESADLFRIRTMGFRGEALASIAAVAMVELISRPEESEVGTRILMQGSVLQKQDYCSSPVGTNISVKKLFFNTPARRKFLKSDPVEFRHIQEEFQRVALAYPDISFSLHHNDNEVLHLPTSNLRKRVIGIFGKNTNEKLVPIHEETEAVTIRGFVGKPDSSKKTRGDQYFFVNNRFFKSPYLHHSVLGAYVNLILPGHYPLYAIYFEMSPENVDVNVHPTKQEIKFQDERLIYHYLKVSIRHALGKFSIIPSLSFETEPAFGSIRPKLPSQDSSQTFSSPGDTQQLKPQKNWDAWEKLYEDSTAPPAEGKNENDAVVIDASWDQNAHSLQVDQPPIQIHNKYVLSPIKSGFLLIHQHHAHSRILFEKFMSVNQGSPLTCQKLLFPETIHLQSQEAQLLQSFLENLRTLGFDIDLFGQSAFIVHGIPGFLSEEKNPGEWLTAFLEIYLREESNNMQLAEKLAWSLAKPAAIKSGKRLSVEEMRELIDSLFGCEHPYRTPRGGLCFIQYSLETIERQFKS